VGQRPRDLAPAPGVSRRAEPLYWGNDPLILGGVRRFAARHATDP
jgi:hypothetical protein